MENHHVAGSANSEITIGIGANDHRARLSEDQKDWPPETLQNKDGSPLLAAAGCVRGYVDTVVYLAERLLLWVAELLERLNTRLVDEYGPKWWLNTDIQRIDLKRRNTNA